MVLYIVINTAVTKLEYCIMVSFVSDVSFKMFICFRTISQFSSEQSQDQHMKTTITGPTFKNDDQ